MHDAIALRCQETDLHEHAAASCSAKKSGHTNADGSICNLIRRYMCERMRGVHCEDVMAVITNRRN